MEVPWEMVFLMKPKWKWKPFGKNKENNPWLVMNSGNGINEE